MAQFNDDVLVVYFTEARILDEATIAKIGEDLEAMVIKASENGKLLLNFQEVRFMSSAMLGKIVKLNKKCKAEETKLKLCNISKDIMEVFTLMRLNKILDIYADESKAISAFNKKGFFG